MAAPVLSNLRAHTSALGTHSSWSCTQIKPLNTASSNKLQKQPVGGKKAKPREPGDAERKEKNNYTITIGRECNRHQVISQLEDLGVNHSSNLTKDGINDKKQESSSSGTE